MLANSLTREVGLRAGPVLLDSLIKHYADRLKDQDRRHSGGSVNGVPLRRDDALYDGAFSIVKAFLEASSYHTVEDLQGFSNTRTPSPPWVHVVRIEIPMCSCEEAASNLIQALGGEDFARRIVGGCKWWQVRGVNGVDAQWITAKKDWREAKKRYKMRQQSQKAKDETGHPIERTSEEEQTGNGVYEQCMDEMRCILYLHGGGYYFGSVDQERYSIQRLARKINGRVLAINYRLAPQYPFPCGLQDALAAYLFLIKPPAGSAHCPVSPGHIVIAGDSAGGGLALALLQVIRDTDLPPPAGGVLLSPWCDMTHSFPSIHTNMDTDIIPSFGLSFHKPSILWPPPSEEISSHVHASLRQRIRRTFGMDDPQQSSDAGGLLRDASQNKSLKSPDMPVDVGATISLPSHFMNSEAIRVEAKNGEILEINQQVQLYTLNSLLSHPLVSPALGYLGGLPPLLFVASDKEVLRDEILYTAHLAADPGKLPIKDEVRALYPPLQNIESRYQPTSVHLQVYDDVAHILPVLFSFTTPAKFCFRAMATFTKVVTGASVQPSLSVASSTLDRSLLYLVQDSLQEKSHGEINNEHNVNESPHRHATANQCVVSNHEERRKSGTSLGRSLSLRIARVSSSFRPKRLSQVPRVISESEQPSLIPSIGQDSTAISDVEEGPRYRNSSPVPMSPKPYRTAGEGSVYNHISDCRAWNSPMIRERVSVQGVIRSLEPESELAAFQMPRETVGKISELAVRRYLAGKALFDEKYARTVKSIEKNRRHNLHRSKKDASKRIEALRQSLERNAPECPEKKEKIKARLLSSPGWGWAWALDAGEDPPPSSIVSRRDTDEAQKLAETADQAILGDHPRLSANNLWSLTIDLLTMTPGRSNNNHLSPSQDDSGGGRDNLSKKTKVMKRSSRFPLWSSSAKTEGKKSHEK